MPRQRFIAQDDQIIPIVKRDLSGGMNSRQHEQVIGDNQAVLLQNILLETAGSRQLRSGQTLVDANFPNNVLGITDTDVNIITDTDANIVTDTDGN